MLRRPLIACDRPGDSCGGGLDADAPEDYGGRSRIRLRSPGPSYASSSLPRGDWCYRGIRLEGRDMFAAERIYHQYLEAMQGNRREVFALALDIGLCGQLEVVFDSLL